MAIIQKRGIPDKKAAVLLQLLSDIIEIIQ